MMFRVLNQTEHEAKCRRCGMSCHTPILLGTETVIVPEVHCLFLGREKETNEYYCTVYDRRFELAPWCKTAVEAIPLKALAWDCPYGEGIPNFQGKRWARDWERDAIHHILRDALLLHGLPYADNPDSALKILNRNGEVWTYHFDGTNYRFTRVIGEAANSPHSASTDSAPRQDPSSL